MLIFQAKKLCLLFFTLFPTLTQYYPTVTPATQDSEPDEGIHIPTKRRQIQPTEVSSLSSPTSPAGPGGRLPACRDPLDRPALPERDHSGAPQVTMAGGGGELTLSSQGRCSPGVQGHRSLHGRHRPVGAHQVSPTHPPSPWSLACNKNNRMVTQTYKL